MNKLLIFSSIVQKDFLKGGFDLTEINNASELIQIKECLKAQSEDIAINRNFIIRLINLMETSDEIFGLIDQRLSSIEVSISNIQSLID